MINNGAWSYTPTTKGKVTIPAGHHDGSGYIDTSGVYSQGYIDGQNNVTANLNISYKYHEHSGNSSVVGGCYGNVSGTRTCGGRYYVYMNASGWIASCYSCGTNGVVGQSSQYAAEAWASGKSCGAKVPYTSIGVVCGKTTDTIESATIIY